MDSLSLIANEPADAHSHHYGEWTVFSKEI